MGRAKIRQHQIEALKAKGPKKRLRIKWRETPVSEDKVFHFKNAGARTMAIRDHAEIMADIHDCEALTRQVKLGNIPTSLVQPVTMHVRTKQQIPLAYKTPRPPQPVVLVTGRRLDREEFAVHVQGLATIMRGKGFREPSAKAKNWGSTTLVEQASIGAGLSPPRTFERSKRGEQKLEDNRRTKALIYLERLIRDYPTRASDARHNVKARRWFFGQVMAAMKGDIDQNWLLATVNQKIEIGIQPKYLSAHARRRLEAQELGVADLMADGQVYAFKEAA